MRGLKSAILAIFQTGLGWLCPVSAALKNPLQEFKNYFCFWTEDRATVVLKLDGLLWVKRWWFLVQDHSLMFKRYFSFNFLLLFKIFWKYHKNEKRPCGLYKGSLVSFLPCPFTGPKMFWAGPNFLHQTKKNIYILWQSQTFSARQKDDLHSVKLVYVPAQKVLKWH